MKPVKLIMPFLFLALICCCQDMTKELPSFDPVKVNENIIVLENDNVDYNHQIILFDVSTEKILYTYDFKGFSFCGLWFDFSFNEKIFIETSSGRFIELDIPTGKTKEIELDFQSWSIMFLDGYLWLFPGQKLENGQSSRVFRFARDMSSKWTTFTQILPRGINTQLDGNVYISYMDIFFKNNGVYNYTSKNFVDISSINPNDECIYLQDNFLWLSYERSENQNGTNCKMINELYKINSFEPLDYQKIISTPASMDVLIFKVFENDKDVFLYCRESIVIVDKSTRQITKQIPLPDAKYVGDAYCRNGSIWCCAEKSDGVYKFNMSDYSLKVIH